VGRDDHPKGINTPTPNFQERLVIMAAGAWITLVFAGLMETGWAIGLKYT